MELKKIGVLSLAKITTIFGLIIGIVQIVFLAIFQRLTSNLPIEQIFGTNFTPITLNSGLISILFIVAGYFLIGIFVALIYNLIAKIFGGVKLELKEPNKK